MKLTISLIEEASSAKIKYYQEDNPGDIRLL